MQAATSRAVERTHGSMDRIIRRLALGVGYAASVACWPLEDLSSYADGATIASLQPVGADAAAPDVLRADHLDLPPAVFVPSADDPLDVDGGTRLPSSGADASATGPCAGEGEVFDPEAFACYRLSRATSSWAGAALACRAEGARLVTIGSRREDTLLTSSFDVTFWTGANDRATTGRFEWESGEPFVYSNFDAGEPNHLFGLQHCVEKIPSNGTWHDRDCSVQNRFICERAESSAPAR